MNIPFTKKKSGEESPGIDYRLILESREASYTKRVAELVREIEVLKAERMGDDYSKRKAVRLMEVSIADPIPSDEESRKRYVREVATFYSDIFEKKIMQMISFVREELDWSGLTDQNHPASHLNGMTREQYDWLMRGTSNSFKLLLDWGKDMQSEHAANVQAEKDALTSKDNAQ